MFEHTHAYLTPRERHCAILAIPSTQAAMGDTEPPADGADPPGSDPTDPPLFSAEQEIYIRDLVAAATARATTPASSATDPPSSLPPPGSVGESGISLHAHIYSTTHSSQRLRCPSMRYMRLPWIRTRLCMPRLPWDTPINGRQAASI